MSINKKNDLSKAKILLGPSDIGNNINTMGTVLKQKGYNATCVEYYKKKFDFRTDKFYNLSGLTDKKQMNQKSKEIANELIPAYDIFHLMYGRTLTRDYSDIELFKKLKKKVVMQHNGGDVRSYSRAIEICPYKHLIKEDFFDKKKKLAEDAIKKKLELLSSFINDCIVMDYELYEYVKDYYKNVHILMKLIDLSKYEINKEENKNDKLVILHAPSNPIPKGTKYICKAIEELSSSYDFEFVLVQGLPHEEAKALYKRADIIIDQVINGCYGTFSLEGMALGKPVICYISDFMKDKYPNELPIFSANPDNVKEKIEVMIKDSEMRKELGRKGREYAEMYHDSNKQIIKLLNIYQNL